MHTIWMPVTGSDACYLTLLTEGFTHELAVNFNFTLSKQHKVVSAILVIDVVLNFLTSALSYDGRLNKKKIPYTHVVYAK